MKKMFLTTIMIVSTAAMATAYDYAIVSGNNLQDWSKAINIEEAIISSIGTVNAKNAIDITVSENTGNKNKCCCCKGHEHNPNTTINFNFLNYRSNNKTVIHHPTSGGVGILKYNPISHECKRKFTKTA